MVEIMNEDENSQKRNEVNSVLNSAVVAYRNEEDRETEKYVSWLKRLIPNEKVVDDLLRLNGLPTGDYKAPRNILD